jgi:putative endonuclease
MHYLQAQGLRLLARNYRCRNGEIDLIMQQGALLVFIEVRYRHSAAYGGALASIDRCKFRRINRCAWHYLITHPRHLRQQCRFDVVLIEGNTGIHWLENVWQEK